MALLHLAIGLAFLVGGAELLVRGASRLAAAFGISPLVVGLTVVACGTSSPELAVSAGAALSGRPDIALGNVIGSNIFNVLFILGASAIIAPLVVSSQLVWLDVPIMVAASVVTWVLCLDGVLGRLDAALLLAGIIAYTAFLVRKSRGESVAVQAEFAAEFGRDGQAGWPVQVALVVAGLGILVLGSRWFVDGATALAHLLGVSDLVIGLTIVAAGTSMPEVATSIMATIRGERDIAVGNVVGSNLFNLLAILGVSGLVAPGGLVVPPSMLGFDLPVMIAVAFACVPIVVTGHVIARWEGFLFLGYYVAYTTYLVLASVEHDALPMLSLVLAQFALPLTAVTLAITVARAVRARRAAGLSGPRRRAGR